MSESDNRAERGPGRPSGYNRELVDKILMSIAVGEYSLRQACALHDVAPGTFSGWVVDDVDGISERYWRARKVRAHGRIDEMYDIADNTSKDFHVDAEGKLHVDREHIARSAERIKLRQWELARMLRDELGDKVEHTDPATAALAGAVDSLVGKLGGHAAEGGAPVAPAEPGEGGAA